MNIQSGYIHRGRQLYQDRGRDWSYAATTQEHQDCWQLPEDRQTRGVFFFSEHGLLSPLTLNFQPTYNHGRITPRLLICYHSPRKQIPSVSKNMEQQDLSHMAGGNVKWYCHLKTGNFSYS